MKLSNYHMSVSGMWYMWVWLGCGQPYAYVCTCTSRERLWFDEYDLLR